MLIGSMCSGYGGLDMAVQQVFGGEVAWHAELDPDASKVLAHRYPGVPNLGDITTVDWRNAPAVDIVTAGFPCQPFSVAGRRQGPQDERWLWDDIARAIAALRPSLVVLENVPGLLTAPGRQPDCVCGWNLRWGRHLGDLLNDHEWTHEVLAADGRGHGEATCTERPRRDVRRSAGSRSAQAAGQRGDAALGNIGREHCLPAGAHAALPHREASAGKARAGDAPAGVATLEEPARDRVDAAGLKRVGGGEGSDRRVELAWDGDHGRVDCPACGRSVDDPTQRPVRRAVGDVLRSLAELGFDAVWSALRASDVGAPHQRWRWFLLATAADAMRTRQRGQRSPVTDRWSISASTAPADPAGDGWDEWRPEPARLERRPDVALGSASPPADASGQQPERWGVPGVLGEPAAAEPCEGHQRQRAGDSAWDRGAGHAVNWGAYEPAIRRWEAVTGRPAPRPTEPGRNGERLSPAFVEWLMGLPAGHVTDVPGISRNAQLRLLGNGVVPDQAAVALPHLLDRMEAAA